MHPFSSGLQPAKYKLTGHVDFQLKTEICNVLMSTLLDFSTLCFLFSGKIIAFLLVLFVGIVTQVGCLAELKSLRVRGPGGSMCNSCILTIVTLLGSKCLLSMHLEKLCLNYSL